VILVPQHIADAHDLRPRNMGLRRLMLRRDSPRGLRNNFNAALDAVAQ
jgi:hypothetical protein